MDHSDIAELLLKTLRDSGSQMKIAKLIVVSGLVEIAEESDLINLALKELCTRREVEIIGKPELWRSAEIKLFEN